MSERVQKKKTTAQKEQVVEQEVKPAEAETGEKLKKEMDELLDEIEGVLEQNAEEFVRGYIQKGGQAVRVILKLWHGSVQSVTQKLKIQTGVARTFLPVVVLRTPSFAI